MDIGGFMPSSSSRWCQNTMKNLEEEAGISCSGHLYTTHEVSISAVVV